jgi:homoserine kinase
MSAPSADAEPQQRPQQRPHSDATARAFAPASVGNIGVGFDLLGHAIDGPRDIATVRRIDAPEVRIDAIRGDVPGVDALPLEAARNTAGRALIALRESLALPYGFAVELEKGIPLGSGLGGSAASCVAALVAANALLDTHCRAMRCIRSRCRAKPWPAAACTATTSRRCCSAAWCWRRRSG